MVILNDPNKVKSEYVVDFRALVYPLECGRCLKKISGLRGTTKMQMTEHQMKRAAVVASEQILGVLGFRFKVPLNGNESTYTTENDDVSNSSFESLGSSANSQWRWPPGDDRSEYFAPFL